MRGAAAHQPARGRQARLKCRQAILGRSAMKILHSKLIAVCFAALAAASALAVGPAQVRAQSPAAFYKGRTVTVWVGFSAGGG